MTLVTEPTRSNKAADADALESSERWRIVSVHDWPMSDNDREATS